MWKDSVKSVEVWSATKSYLIQGILGVVFAVLLELLAIRQIVIGPKSEGIGLAIILQLPVLICLLLSSLIRNYKYRKKFNLYYCELDNADIKEIKRDYYICEICGHAVLFCEKKDIHNYSIYKILQGSSCPCYLEDMFGDDEDEN